MSMPCLTLVVHWVVSMDLTEDVTRDMGKPQLAMTKHELHLSQKPSQHSCCARQLLCIVSRGAKTAECGGMCSV